jgi:hypothetical protein
MMSTIYDRVFLAILSFAFLVVSLRSSRPLLSTMPSITLRETAVILVGLLEWDVSWTCPRLITPRTLDFAAPEDFASLS